ncbi:SGNH/GDSL hydrolase family protein [bacterium]|nr:SGNH/GDSL hydrolase family protein [bacterium]
MPSPDQAVDTLAADSPVTFPTDGPAPATYPCDLPAENRPPEPDYYLFSTPERSLEQIRTVQAEMIPGTFTPPPADWGPLQRARRLLTEGGDFHLLGLGDSIVNDTMRSGWVGLLQEAYPRARVRGTVCVRGCGGCQHYKLEERIAKVVVPLRPDVVYIGGISQADIESIREVVGQLRAGLPEVEVLLATGTFGRADPRDPVALAAAPYSGTGPWGAALQALAAELGCAYLDMTGPWAEYLRSTGVHPHLFFRDAVHANEFGEQILARIMMAFWTAQA